MNPIRKTGSRKVFARGKESILMHWFNVVCWFVLTFSGLGIIRGDLRFMPKGYAEWMQNAVGGQFVLIVGHSLLGLLWAGAFVVFTAMNWNRVVVPFLREVLSITPRAVLRDLREMVIIIARLFGLMRNAHVPPAVRYNGAQRLLGTMILLSAAAIAFTGTVMFYLFLFTPVFVSGIVFRWSLLVHAFFVGFVYIGLMAHLYYSLIEDPGSLDAMLSGYLDVEYIRHHNPGWYAELKEQGKI